MKRNNGEREVFAYEHELTAVIGYNVRIALMVSLIMIEIRNVQRKIKYLVFVPAIINLLITIGIYVLRFSRWEECIIVCLATTLSVVGTIVETVLSIDLNDLKKINDTQGHTAGDQAICEVTRMLQNHLKRGCRLYRVGVSLRFRHWKGRDGKGRELREGLRPGG